MKKLHVILGAFLVSAIAYAASQPARTVLSTSVKAGNTATVYVGRVIGEPKDDGSLSLTVVPLIIKTDSEGTELSREWGSENIELTLSASQFSGISTIVKAAYDAKVAAEATK